MLNLSRNRIAYREDGDDTPVKFTEDLSNLVMPELRQLCLFGNYLDGDELFIRNVCKIAKENFENLQTMNLHGNPCIDANQQLNAIFFDKETGRMKEDFFRQI